MVGEASSTGEDVRLDLRSARVLCVDETVQGLDILAQILMGFGVQNVVRAQFSDDARDLLTSQIFDLVLVDAGKAGDGYELIYWLRRTNLQPNRYAPVLVLSGYTPKSQVEFARDAGSSFVVTKPISARTLLDRIFFVARANRPFIESSSYVGPDRRFKNDGVPAGGPGRRANDLSTEVGDAREPNMSQDEIDNLMKPQRVAL